ncbi:MAG TPA: glycoside hydrolase family 88 protein [Lacunisphaera sp.]|jgi:unsaturated chondroitin disaccharide hydrolase|nr:glycoside hydrolase family 88 protein [Lacunisphaera sp.]
MKLPILALTLALLCPALRAAEAPLADVVRAALSTSANQYEWMLAHLPADAAKPLPRTFDHGRLVTVPTRDWTSGFFPGSLWYLFEATGDGKWRAAAEKFTGLLAPEQHNTQTHDVGFMLYCSYGNGLRLTGNEAYKSVLLNGAQSLSTRFNPTVGAIKSWDPGVGPYTFPVIIDNMMNLELMMWAAREGPADRYRDLAIRHADTTLAHHFRADHSTVHVVDYDPTTGQVIKRVTHQGTSDDSAWARGQAWGLYGYTVMYRETKDPRYLAQAQQIAAFVMHHPRLPADKVPYWDFDDARIPNAPRDSSAAAIICSALLELRGYAAPDLAADYTAFAEAQLRSLCSPAYLAEPGTNGGFLLKHATGNHPKNSEIDTPINYTDYYFLEALLRARKL